MQEIKRGLRAESLSELAKTMDKSGEAMSYPEMLTRRDDVFASEGGNRAQRRKAKALNRKPQVTA